jgi:hypothetical protein
LLLNKELRKKTRTPEPQAKDAGLPEAGRQRSGKKQEVDGS